MAILPIDEATWYTVEARVRSGDHEAALPGDAVILHQVVLGRPEPPWAVDADVPPADYGSNPGTMWTPGETFTDVANDLSVTVDYATPTGFGVTITRGDDGLCGPGATDTDKDGVADACDVCEGHDDADDDDGDGVPDACDVCDGDDRLDGDADGTPDDCDLCFGPDNVDTDGDGVCDSLDACLGDDATGDVDGDLVCADLDCDDDDPDAQFVDACDVCGGDNVCVVFSDDFESGDASGWSG